MCLVGLGAGCGAVLRYLLTMIGKQVWPGRPYATMVINVLGAFCAGLLTALAPSAALRLLLLTGVCGGFTTFSTFETDAFILVRNHQWGRFAWYYGGSVVLGLVACLAGAGLGCGIG